MLGKESGKQLTALRRKHPTDDFRPVVEAAIAKHIPQASGGTGLLVKRSKNNFAHARLHRGTRAHRAWFKRYDQSAPIETPVRQHERCLPKRNNFGMSCWINIDLASVRTSTDYHAIAI